MSRASYVRKFAARHGWWAALCGLVAMLAGCAAPPMPSPFAQCMKIVAAEAIYQTDKLRAADWCAEHTK